MKVRGRCIPTAKWTLPLFGMGLGRSGPSDGACERGLVRGCRSEGATHVETRVGCLCIGMDFLRTTGQRDPTQSTFAARFLTPGYALVAWAVSRSKISAYRSRNLGEFEF